MGASTTFPSFVGGTSVIQGDAVPVSWSVSLHTAINNLEKTAGFNLREYGAVGNGVADDTTAWNNFIAALKAATYPRYGYIPSGTYNITAQPSAIDFGVVLFGDGLNQTVLKRNFNPVGNKGLLELIPGCNGTVIRDMAVEAAAGTSGGSVISIIGTAGGATIAAVVLENLWLTTFGSDTHANTVYMDGSARITNPIGIRTIDFKHVHVFGCSGYSVYAKGVVGWSWNGGGVYPAGGTGVASGAIQITGDGTVPSQYIDINILVVDGLNLTYCSDVIIAAGQLGDVGGLSIANDNTCSNTTVIGRATGTTTTNWVASCHISGGTLIGSTLTSPNINGGSVDITSGTIILPTQSPAAQTAEGSIAWDGTANTLSVGDGVSRKTMVDTDTPQTLAAKTLTTPTIGDLSNATHAHAAAASGGSALTPVTVLASTSVAGQKSGSVSKVQHSGKNDVYFAIGNNQVMTFTFSGFAHIFTVTAGGGQWSDCVTGYDTTTITIAGTTSYFVNSSTPGAAQIGIYKSINSNVISVKAGSAVAGNICISARGDYISAVTDPA